MDTPAPEQKEIEKVEVKKKKVSAVSQASLVLAILSIIPTVIILVAMFGENDTFEALGYISIFFLIPALLISFIAFILGIIGLFQKKSKKVFSIIGIIPFSLVLLVIGAIVLKFGDFNDPGKLPWKDNFKSEYWNTGTDEDYEISYQNDELRILVKTPNHQVWSNLESDEEFSDIHMEVTAIRITTDMNTQMGLRCDTQSKTANSYVLWITSAGNYAIMRGVYDAPDIILTNNGEWANSGLIKKNSNSYRIGADCGNGAISLYVDGVKIDTVYDSNFKQGGIALIVESAPEAKETIVGFDDFEMKKLK